MQEGRKSKLVKGPWRYQYALVAMERAEAACSLISSQIKDDDHPLYFPLIAAVCVTYSKPFTANNGLGAVPEDYKILPTPDLQRTHDIVWASRNYVFAHTDLLKTRIANSISDESIYKLHINVEARENGAGTVYTFGRGISEPKLKAVVVPDILSLCVEQKQRFEAKANDYMGKLFHGRRLRPGLRTLNVGQQPW